MNNNQFEIYWYRESEAVERAFLYNCRDADLRPGSGKVRHGAIVAGKCGFVVAEEDLPGFSGTEVSFKPNRHCCWQKFTLPCMALPSIPGHLTDKPSLRHKHHVVAELVELDAVQLAKDLGVPVVVVDSRNLVNLEVTTFERQTKSRRAKLLAAK